MDRADRLCFSKRVFTDGGGADRCHVFAASAFCKVPAVPYRADSQLVCGRFRTDLLSGFAFCRHMESVPVFSVLEFSISEFPVGKGKTACDIPSGSGLGEGVRQLLTEKQDGDGLSSAKRFWRMVCFILCFYRAVISPGKESCL